MSYMELSSDNKGNQLETPKRLNSKRKGNAFEREIAFRLRKELWPQCQTSRFMGQLWLDHCGVDLTGTPGFNIQLKALERVPSYHSILARMPRGQNKNIIIHKRNNSGCVVVLGFEDFLKLIKR